MSTHRARILRWFFTLGAALIGMAAVVVFNPLGRFDAVSAAPTITPTITSVPANAELPPFEVSPEFDAIVRLAQLHTYRPEKPRFEVFQYTVQQGDTAWTIAQKFNIQPETILWGNEGLSTNAGALRIGAVLNILPVDGVLHTVREGDTLERLQQLHGVPVQDIVNFIGNDFKGEIPEKLMPGEQVIVPGGKNPILWQEPGPQVIPGKGRKSPGYYSGPLVYMGTGYFAWPVSPISITQPYWSGHQGIDIGMYPRQPIFAADNGTVIFSGWDKTGFGNLVIIDHGNGYWSYYGHNTANLVKAGDGVLQGQQIAEAGSTGNSTGDHLDFRIRVDGGSFLNPDDFLP